MSIRKTVRTMPPKSAPVGYCAVSCVVDVLADRLLLIGTQGSGLFPTLLHVLLKVENATASNQSSYDMLIDCSAALTSRNQVSYPVRREFSPIVFRGPSRRTTTWLFGCFSVSYSAHGDHASGLWK